MQEIKFKDNPESSREFFEATRETEQKALAAINSKMDKRLTELENQHGEAESVTRKHVGRNSRCPCGSGLKFKKCCISKCR